MARPSSRIKALLVFLACIGAAFSPECQSAETKEDSSWSQLQLVPTDRLLILASHPDDEILGCGGIIQKAVEMKLPLRIIFLTYGDYNGWSFLVYQKHLVLMPGAVRQMGLIRHDEALMAAEIMGLSQDQMTFLGYPDYGTLNIWYSHWGDRPPFQSALTRVKRVPYTNALRFGAGYKGEEILRDIKTVLLGFRPTKIFVTHPADHHPDHRAFYLFTRVALWDLQGEMRPAVYPYLIHYKRWPSPLGKQDGELLEPPAALQDQIPWRSYSLSPGQRERKRLALQAHGTQYDSSARYLLSFVRANELFGDFPEISLREEASTATLSPRDKEQIQKSPEHLTDEERAFFVGAEWRYAQLEADKLLLSIDLSRPLAKEVGVSFYIFGYRSDRPFEQMPKLHVKVGLFRTEVFHQNQRLPPKLVQVIRGPKQIILTVPLEIVGYPDKVLTSAQTYLGEVALDWVSWRILQLQ